MPLITRKLSFPDLPNSYVVRPRVRQQLVTSIERHRLVFVSASAGSGKTTAVIDAVRSIERAVAWLSLDRSDATPGRLLTYLEASVAQIVPDVAGVASRAMAAQIPHPEAAGLLAEAVGEAHPVIVLDNVERLGEAEPAWAVLDAFVRYSEPATLVLVSRRSLPAHLLDLPAELLIGVVDEAELALTKPEAEDVLDRVGRNRAEAAPLIEVSGGWVAGVVFGSMQAIGEPAGGRVDRLHNFFMEQVIGRLPPPVQEFLTMTSLLPEVDADRATALGVAHAAEHLTALRAVNLPGTWDAHQRAFRWYPLFRDFLLERLAREPSVTLRNLQLAHARMLAADGDDEAAVEAFLRANAPDEARATAQQAIMAIINRADLVLAESWLEVFADAEPPTAPGELTIARLAVAIVKDDHQRGVAVCDSLAAAGTREKLAHDSDHAAVLMAWLYGAIGRLEEADTIVCAAQPSPSIQAICYGLGLLDPSRSCPRPVPMDGPVDAYVLGCDYFRGFLTEFATPPKSRWVRTITGPYSIGALRVTGLTQQALDTYRAYTSRLDQLLLQTYIGPEVLVDAGLISEARKVLGQGRRLAASKQAFMFELLAHVTEAKIAARCDKDSDSAHQSLDRIENIENFQQFWCVQAMASVWRGLALLLEDRVEEAAERLRRAVSTMLTARGVLELPTAAVYLAEAEWRLGDTTAADAAADIALEAAQQQGSNHLLLQALADFPLVVSRRLDAEPIARSEVTSAWHAIGRSLSRQRTHSIGIHQASAIEFNDFGAPPAVLVNGVPIRPRIAKSYELLAYLVLQPGRAAKRSQLLTELFDGRADEASRSYLRQALRWLKLTIPGEDSIITDRWSVQLSEALKVKCASLHFETKVAEASRLRDGARIGAMIEALKISERGDFLEGIDTRWVTQRRQELHRLEVETHFELATLMYSSGQLTEAQHHMQVALRQESFRESGWRLLMRIASELGDSDGVIHAFHQYETALGEFGIAASPRTRQLLRNLLP